ncbi:MAG: ATP-binding protein, partial [Clostridia bacterium]|nr:ATP-binding protein [Clostridia bacterium]
GAAYNPLEREDPDVTLSAEEREVGGLGIFLVRQTMDAVHYHRTNGWNMLTIQKQMSETSGEETPHEV